MGLHYTTFSSLISIIKIGFLLTNDGTGFHKLYRSQDQGLHWTEQVLTNPTGQCYVVRIYEDLVNPQHVRSLPPPLLLSSSSRFSHQGVLVNISVVNFHGPSRVQLWMEFDGWREFIQLHNYSWTSTHLLQLRPHRICSGQDIRFKSVHNKEWRDNMESDQRNTCCLGPFASDTRHRANGEPVHDQGQHAWLL